MGGWNRYEDEAPEGVDVEDGRYGWGWLAVDDGLEKDALRAVGGRRDRLLAGGSVEPTTLAERRRSADDPIESDLPAFRRGTGEVVVVVVRDEGPDVKPNADEARRPDEEDAEDGVGVGPKSDSEPVSSTVLGTGVVFARIRRGLKPALEYSSGYVWRRTGRA